MYVSDAMYFLAIFKLDLSVLCFCFLIWPAKIYLKNLVYTRLRRIQRYSHKLSSYGATVRKREAFHTPY